MLGSRALDAPVPPREILLTALLCVWALRLAGFLFFRVLRTGRDARFDGTRDRFFPFLGFWVAQMVWVWTVALPVTVLNAPAVLARSAAAATAVPFGTSRDVAGLVLYGVGLVCEAVADAQRFRFRAATQRRGAPLAVCQTGLFAWSRHPNYFGEMLVQFGLFTVAASDAASPHGGGSTAAVYATIAGPVLLTLLLFFVSGMNLAERPAAARRYAAGGAVWDAYQAYLQRTSLLVPLPPALYGRLPVWVKRTLLLEFPLYVFDPAKHAVPADAGPAAVAAKPSDPAQLAAHKAQTRASSTSPGPRRHDSMEAGHDGEAV